MTQGESFCECLFCELLGVWGLGLLASCGRICESCILLSWISSPALVQHLMYDRTALTHSPSAAQVPSHIEVPSIHPFHYPLIRG